MIWACPPPRPTTLSQWRVTCVSQIILSSSRCSKCHLRGRRAVWVLTWNLKACLSPRCCCCSYSVVWGPQSLVSFLASHSPQCASEASGPWWDWNFQTPRISVEGLPSLPWCRSRTRPDREIMYVAPSSEEASGRGGQDGCPQPCSQSPLCPSVPSPGSPLVAGVKQRMSCSLRR